MKALSVQQPYASLICAGIKNIENRTWPTKYRGEILIHACGKPLSDNKKLWSKLNQEQWEHVNDYVCTDGFHPERLEFGAIIGSVKIIDCIQGHDSIWAEHQIKEPKIPDYIISGLPAEWEIYNTAFYQWQDSKPIWNWVLSEPEYFDEPIINIKGKLSLWEFDLIDYQLDKLGF